MSDATQPTTFPERSVQGQHGENTLLWTVWFTYGAFYFCRTNISAAVPGLKESVDVGGAGLTATQVSLILGGTKIAYAAGQLINGQFSELLPPRKLLAIGMLGTAALNLLFGFGTALYFLIFIWACNGYSQSLGWTPCVRVLANWFPIERRGKVIGFVGTGYQVTAVATYLVAGAAASAFGWRGALLIPAGIMVVAAVIMFLFLEERPDARHDSDARGMNAAVPSREITNAAESLPTSGSGAPRGSQGEASPGVAAPGNNPSGSVLDNFLLTISNPSLWLLGISLGLLNACRYGFLDWGLTHLKEVQETGVGKAALKYAVLPLGAIAGSYLSGWATDRFFGSRRAVTCLLLVALCMLSLTYDRVARASVPGTMLLLVLIGFCIYGPQVLLVGTAPANLARGGTSAAAAGFVNCMGYVGAATGDYWTGRTLDAYGWETAILLWAGLGPGRGDCRETTVERNRFARRTARDFMIRTQRSTGEYSHDQQKTSRKNRLDMRAIIIGAGRGSRLMPTTTDTPKCFAEVAGQRMLDWAIDAFRENDVREIAFIGGYRIEVVQEAYPSMTFRHNADWINNNILASLLHAEDLMDEPFVCCYSDILFTPAIVEAVLESDADIALGVDTGWLTRYEQRTEHPSDDAEKVTVANGAVTKIHRQIPEAAAYGEYIGLAKFSADGAAALRETYHSRREEFAGKAYREAKVFEKAYLIHLLQDMIESGRKMAHVDTPGGYIEVDTQQDFEYARQFWIERHRNK